MAARGEGVRASGCSLIQIKLFLLFSARGDELSPVLNVTRQYFIMSELSLGGGGGGVLINKGGALQWSLITGASEISGYRSRRGKGEWLPPSLPPPPSCRTGGGETERVVWWEAGGLVSNQSCKSHQPSTVSSLPAHPGDGRHTNLLRPQGTKIHTIIYFTFMSSCVMKIKSKVSQGAPGSVSLSFFLPSPSIFSSPSPLLLAFEVLIRSYWCMKVKCRLYIGDHFAAPGHAGCSHI